MTSVVRGLWVWVDGQRRCGDCVRRGLWVGQRVSYMMLVSRSHIHIHACATFYATATRPPLNRISTHPTTGWGDRQPARLPAPGVRLPPQQGPRQRSLPLARQPPHGPNPGGGLWRTGGGVPVLTREGRVNGCLMCKVGVGVVSNLKSKGAAWTDSTEAGWVSV